MCGIAFVYVNNMRMSEFFVTWHVDFGAKHVFSQFSRIDLVAGALIGMGCHNYGYICLIILL